MSYISIFLILTEYEMKTSEDKVSILYSALSYMQQHNNRTKKDCIALAMGYQNDIGNHNEWYKN